MNKISLYLYIDEFFEKKNNFIDSNYKYIYRNIESKLLKTINDNNIMN